MALFLQNVCKRYLKLLTVYKWRRLLVQYIALRLHYVIKIQALVRRFLVRSRMLEKLRRRYKIKIKNKRDASSVKSKTRSSFSLLSSKNLQSLIGGGNITDEIDPKFTSQERDRRMGMLFLNMNIGTLENFQRLHSAASSIQLTYRVHLARRWRKREIQKRRVVSVKRIIRWYRLQCFLQDRDDAAWVWRFVLFHFI